MANLNIDDDDCHQMSKMTTQQCVASYDQKLSAQKKIKLSKAYDDVVVLCESIGKMPWHPFFDVNLKKWSEPIF